VLLSSRVALQRTYSFGAFSMNCSRSFILTKSKDRKAGAQDARILVQAGLMFGIGCLGRLQQAVQVGRIGQAAAPTPREEFHRDKNDLAKGAEAFA
jgi:hypothetical protein